MGFRLSELARRLGATVRGDGEREIERVRALEHAGPGDLSFVADPRHRARALRSRAGALLVAPSFGAADRPLLVVEEPSVALAALLAALHPPPVPPPGVHATAVVAGDAAVDPGASIGPYAVIGAGSRIGRQAAIGAHVVVGRGCTVGDGATLHPHAVLYDGTAVGARAIVHAGAVLGADGFGYASADGVHLKIPQVGRTVLEDDVEIGANSAVDRAALEETRIGAGSKIDNLVQVGHNVTTGRGCLLCGQAGVAGSTRLGDFVVLGGKAGVADHLEIGDGTQVAGFAFVAGSLPGGIKAGGYPAVPLKAWHRQVAGVRRVGELARRLRAVEKRLEAAAPRAAEPE